MAKVLTVKPWKDVVAGAQIPDKGLQKALSDYKAIKKEDRAKRTAALTSITRILGDLKRVPQVVAIPAAKNYLTEVAGVLDAERAEIKKLDAEATIDVTITNSSSYDDIFLTVEDLNIKGKKILLKDERLNKKKSITVTLAADGSGQGQIHWIAELTEDAASRKDETVKGIKEGQTIQVRA